MAKARILIVDDSAVFRHALSDLFTKDPGFEVVGTAADGKSALECIRRLEPDLVTLDLEMPVMDGLTTLAEIRTFEKRLPILIFSALTTAGARATLEALHRGASDYCTKPGGGLEAAMAQLERELLPKARALVERDRECATPALPMRRSLGIASAASTTSGAIAANGPKRVDVIAIGCSTGGPSALETLLPSLPANLPCPVLIVQHMPPVFTRLLAERLNSRSSISVLEAADLAMLEPGKAYLAPGDHHMVVERCGSNMRLRLNQDAHENFCRPAIDPMLRSIAELFPGAVLSVILTGMGRDGTKGCAEVRKNGGYVIGQDEATSVVWGMPGSLAEQGLVHELLPLERIGSEIARWALKGRGVVAASTDSSRRPSAR